MPTVLGPSHRIIWRTTTCSTVTFLSGLSLFQFSEPLPSSWGPHGTWRCSGAESVRKIWGDTLAILKPSSWVSVCAASKLAAHRLLCACSLHLTLFGQLFPWFLFGKINFWHWHRNCLGRKPFVGRLLSKVLRNTFARGAHHETSLFFFLNYISRTLTWVEAGHACLLYIFRTVNNMLSTENQIIKGIGNGIPTNTR